MESAESRYLLGDQSLQRRDSGKGEPACSGLDGLRSLAMILAAEAPQLPPGRPSG